MKVKTGMRKLIVVSSRNRKIKEMTNSEENDTLKGLIELIIRSYYIAT